MNTAVAPPLLPARHRAAQLVYHLRTQRHQPRPHAPKRSTTPSKICGLHAEAGEPTMDAMTVDPADIAALRRSMHRFATLQLGDAQWAEDAVQEALLGAFKNQAAYAGKASLKTWVFAILKNKIADVLRSRHRTISTQVTVGDKDEDADLGELFNARGMWDADEHPASWGNPGAALEQQQFWRVFELCLDGLPAQQGRAFMMREYVGLEAPEVCAELGISTTNLHVMLHRARLRLRECLENRWFCAAPGEAA